MMIVSLYTHTHTYTHIHSHHKDDLLLLLVLYSYNKGKPVSLSTSTGKQTSSSGNSNNNHNHHIIKRYSHHMGVWACGCGWWMVTTNAIPLHSTHIHTLLYSFAHTHLTHRQMVRRGFSISEMALGAVVVMMVMVQHMTMAFLLPAGTPARSSQRNRHTQVIESGSRRIVEGLGFGVQVSVCLCVYMWHEERMCVCR